MKIFRIIFVFLVSFFLPLYSELSQLQVLPQYNSESLRIIPFYDTRRTYDGALKEEMLKQLQMVFDTTIFVETGTYLGATTLLASEIFDEVYTVELSQELFEQASNTFKNFKHVFPYQGDSSLVFLQFLPQIQGRIFFYLDGHYSGGLTAQGTVNTPVLGELAAIKAAGKSNSVIMIDDLDCFQKTLFPAKIVGGPCDGYPDLKELVTAILDINPDYEICFLANALFAFPRDPEISLSPVAAACALHRLSSFYQVPAELLDEADKVIGSAEGFEREQLFSYASVYSYEMEMGWQAFCVFWQALVFAQEGNVQRAKSLIEYANRNSLPGWRANDFVFSNRSTPAL